jgi:HK97 family phage prohead protease
MGKRLEVKSGRAGKHLSVVGRELKLADDKPGLVTGYGSVFGVKDSYSDIVAPGAFASSLTEWSAKGRLPSMLWQHDQSEPVGVWTEMVEDGVGLRCTGQLLLSVSKGQEAYEHLKAGTVGGLSIGFQTVERTWNYEEETRTLNRVNLWEVSLVTFPANDAARVSGVKGADRFSTIREFEDFLRDEGGLSHAQAKAVASRGFKAASEARDEPDGLAAVLAALRSANAATNL